jgi:hypothetical protein
MEGYKSAKIWVRPEDWKAFHRKCFLSGKSMREVLEEFVKNFIQALPK